MTTVKLQIKREQKIILVQCQTALWGQCMAGHTNVQPSDTAVIMHNGVA